MRNYGRYTLGASPIHGMGVMAAENIGAGEGIGVAITHLRLLGILGGGRTALGETINHSGDPNSRLEKVHARGTLWRVVAIRDIASGAEITMSYDDTPWFIGGTKIHAMAGTPLKD